MIDWTKPIEGMNGEPADITRMPEDQPRDFYGCYDVRVGKSKRTVNANGESALDGYPIVRNIVDISLWAFDKVDNLAVAENGAASYRRAFARYIMSKEEAPVDPDMIAAREVVCGYHHDKHPESPWHIEQAELVRSGRMDNMLDVQAAYHGIKRGRALERGE